MANRGKERIESQYRVCKSSSFLSFKNQRSRRCTVYKCSSNVIYEIFVQRALILTHKHTLLVSETFSSRVGPIHTFTQTVRAKKRSVVRAEKRSVSCIHNELKCVCICVEFQKFERFVTATRFLLIIMSPYLFNDFFYKTICENTWRRGIFKLFNNRNKIWHLIFGTFFMDDFFFNW